MDDSGDPDLSKPSLFVNFGSSFTSLELVKLSHLVNSLNIASKDDKLPQRGHCQGHVTQARYFNLVYRLTASSRTTAYTHDSLPQSGDRVAPLNFHE